MMKSPNLGKEFSMVDNSDNLFFALFHHDIKYHDEKFNIDSENLLRLAGEQKKIGIGDIAVTLYSIILNNITGLKDSEISLTLTGGLDSRLILACLLKAGIKPNCVTYGDSNARDVVFAGNLANKFGLRFHNPAQPDINKEWYYKWVIETIKRDHGNSHIHRAHRTAAMSEHAAIYSPKVLFTGHMGGEGLRGLTYNNYFASSFFELVNENKASPFEAATKVLNEYFIRFSNENISELLKKILTLPWMKYERNINKFFFLYDLVGKVHHAQDIRLYETFVPKVIPVFMQPEYLEKLFSSEYHLLAKPKGLRGRFHNPYVHCKLLESIYPELLDFPLSNGFSPREYMRGLWYYVPVKSWRKLKQRNLYSAAFSYGSWFVDFVKEHTQNISSEIWGNYDRENYMRALENKLHGTDEGYWHKFSIPIYLDLVHKFKNGSFQI